MHTNPMRMSLKDFNSTFHDQDSRSEEVHLFGEQNSVKVKVDYFLVF